MFAQIFLGNGATAIGSGNGGMTLEIQITISQPKANLASRPFKGVQPQACEFSSA